ncbi:MAG: IS1380 family transposase, partial [Bacteroidota bacterium]|nr:IS1380 family transposase [Bacteroidota bacterium]
FYATEAALNFVMIAYNLMSLFRQVILQSNVQPTLKTMRYRVFAIGSYMVVEGNAKILKLSMAMRRREWFKGLWEKSIQFSWPFLVPS